MIMKKHFSILVTFLGIALSAQAQVPTNGLVAYYPFNGNANDESVNNNHGQINGAMPAANRFEHPNSAYYFDGIDDFISMPDSLPIDNNFTISFWTYCESNTGYHSVLCDGSSSAGGSDFLINLRNTDIGIRADKTGTLNYEDYSPVELSNLDIINKWVHIVWVMTPSNSSIYLDNNLLATINEPGSNIGYHDANSFIGARQVWGTPDNFFHGRIDDVRIYDRPLNESEIQSLFQESGSQFLSEGLLAYFPLNGNANDLSGNGNVGIIQGAVQCKDRYGNEGQALNFNGTDSYVAVDYQFDNTFESQYSISAWVKANSTQESYAKLVCFPFYETQWVDPYHYLGFSYAGSAGEPNAGPGYFDETGFIGGFGTQNLQPGTWELLTFTFDAGLMTMYVNGRLMNSANASKTQMYFPSLWFSIGSRSPYPQNNGEFFNGCIDELYMYNRCLEADEIIDYYNQDLRNDSLALVALYNATQGDSWTNNSNWLTGPLNQWYGITVNDGAVKSISLSNNNLNGSIPPEIGNLFRLENLSLSNNGLTGNIPEEIGNCSSLFMMNLSNSKLEGSLPAEVGSMNALQQIILSGNELTGLPDLSGLNNLFYLWVQNNELTFADLQSLNIDPDLMYFLYSPQANLAEPVTVDNGNGTSTLTVVTDGSGLSYQWFNDGTALTGQTSPSLVIDNGSEGIYYCEVTHPGFQDLTLSTEPLFVNVANTNGVVDEEYNALISLYISLTGNNWTQKDNWLTDADVGDWYGITTSNGHVTRIILNANNLSGVIPPEIGSFPMLKLIYLQGTQITGSIPEEMQQLTKLEVLGIYDTGLTGNIPGWIGNLSSLNSLYLFQNQLSGPIPSSIGNLTNLYDLSLEENMLTGSIPEELGNLTNLYYLWLYGNQLEGEIPASLGNLTNLMQLDLYNNNLSGNIPPDLGNLPNLMELYLNSNQLTGEIPAELGNLSQLRKFSVYNNRLTGQIPPALGNLSSLQRLSMGANELEGSIPSQLGNLTNLQELWLHGNKLTGAIPPEIGSIPYLQSLSLHTNQLSGPVPAELDNLEYLDLLYIDNNQLTSLPDLSSLINLTDVNVSNNYFTFKDLETSGLQFGSYETGIYAPQLELDEPLAFPGGNNILLQCNTNGTGDSYQWYNEDASIPGEVLNELIISNADPGIFWCEVNNGAFPDLILNTRPYFNGVAHSNGIVQDEYNALVELYIATGGSSWTNSSNWLTSEEVDNWYGIESSKGRVRKIDLRSNNLSGSLPSGIGNFTRLEELYLYYNQIAGTIPDELYDLVNLKELWIRENQLEGQISPLIQNLVNLETLQMRTNNFTGSIPTEIGSLSNLKGINLSQSSLEGAVPASFNNLSNLEYLYIYETELSDLPNLSALGNLADFYPHSGRFTFEDFISTGIDFNALQTCIYAPQDKIPVTTDFIEVWQGDVLSFNFQDLTVENLWSNQNEYALFRGETFVADWTGNTEFLIPSASLSHEGMYSIRVRNAIYPDLVLYSDSIQVSVIVNLAPTDVLLTNSSIPENEAVGTVIGSFSTADGNMDDTHTYSLVAGDGTNDADNSHFTISGDQLAAATAFDYEQKSMYNIYVQTEDARGLIYEKSFIIEIGNMNESPTGLSISTTDIAEDADQGSVVGSFTTVDEDTDDSHTYTLVTIDGDDFDNGSFSIVGNDLVTETELDYETKSEYFIYVKTTDQGSLSFQKPLVINITDVEEVGFSEWGSEGLVMYPNPTSGMVYIQLANPGARLEIFDVSGHKIGDQYLYETNNELDLKAHAPGMYILRIEDTDHVWLEKVVKE